MAKVASNAKKAEYPKYYVIHDTGRPIRMLTKQSVPEGATNTANGWEPFLDLEALLEDSDRIDESQLEDALEKWKA